MSARFLEKSVYADKDSKTNEAKEIIMHHNCVSKGERISDVSSEDGISDESICSISDTSVSNTNENSDGLNSEKSFSTSENSAMSIGEDRNGMNDDKSDCTTDTSIWDSEDGDRQNDNSDNSETNIRESDEESEYLSSEENNSIQSTDEDSDEEKYGRSDRSETSLEDTDQDSGEDEVNDSYEEYDYESSENDSIDNSSSDSSNSFKSSGDSYSNKNNERRNENAQCFKKEIWGKCRVECDRKKMKSDIDSDTKSDKHEEVDYYSSENDSIATSSNDISKSFHASGNSYINKNNQRRDENIQTYNQDEENLGKYGVTLRRKKLKPEIDNDKKNDSCENLDYYSEDDNIDTSNIKSKIIHTSKDSYFNRNNEIDEIKEKLKLFKKGKKKCERFCAICGKNITKSDIDTDEESNTTDNSFEENEENLTKSIPSSGRKGTGTNVSRKFESIFSYTSDENIFTTSDESIFSDTYDESNDNGYEGSDHVANEKEDVGAKNSDKGITDESEVDTSDQNSCESSVSGDKETDRSVCESDLSDSLSSSEDDSTKQDTDADNSNIRRNKIDVIYFTIIVQRVKTKTLSTLLRRRNNRH